MNLSRRAAPAGSQSVPTYPTARHHSIFSFHYTQAKKNETRHMDGDSEGDVFNQGECYNTSFVIHEERVQDQVDDADY